MKTIKVKIGITNPNFITVGTLKHGRGLFQDDKLICNALETPQFDNPYQLMRWWKKRVGKFKYSQIRMVPGSAKGWGES